MQALEASACMMWLSSSSAVAHSDDVVLPKMRRIPSRGRIRNVVETPQPRKSIRNVKMDVPDALPGLRALRLCICTSQTVLLQDPNSKRIPIFALHHFKFSLVQWFTGSSTRMISEGEMARPNINLFDPSTEEPFASWPVYHSECHEFKRSIYNMRYSRSAKTSIPSRVWGCQIATFYLATPVLLAQGVAKYNYPLSYLRWELKRRQIVMGWGEKFLCDGCLTPGCMADGKAEEDLTDLATICLLTQGQFTTSSGTRKGWMENTKRAEEHRETRDGARVNEGSAGRGEGQRRRRGRNKRVRGKEETGASRSGAAGAGEGWARRRRRQGKEGRMSGAQRRLKVMGMTTARGAEELAWKRGAGEGWAWTARDEGDDR
ncbi:hypothetical protein FB451DRAFT_1168544 [Mycena latifolia]|nr:hypothetical protein FB451DRAFT_1168544 [Mycena latifolia]